MAVVPGAFPYDLDHLLGGRARVILAPASEPIPASIADVIDMETPYAVQGSWFDLGATRDSASYTKSIESEGLEIQQVSGLVLEEITDINRQIKVSLAEVKAENLKIVEESATTGTVAAAAGVSAQKSVKFGSFSDTTPYRAVFVAQRSKKSGLVVESGAGAPQRGRFVMLCLYSVSLSADETEMEFDKGTLVHAPVTFTAFPEGGEDSGEEYGVWLTEDAGTIA